MKFLPVALLFLLCACVPVETQAQPAPAVNLGAAIGAATQAAEKRADAAQATASAIELKRINAERDAAATTGAIDAARLELERNVARQTQQAATTSDYLGAIATRSAISATATAANLQAVQAAHLATGTAVVDLATRQVVEAQASQAALLIPRQGQATAIALVVEPTRALERAVANERRIDGLFAIIGASCASAAFLLALVACWEVIRLERVLEARVKQVPPARQLPARVEMRPAEDDVRLRRFVVQCNRISGPSATLIPGWRRFAERAVTEFATGPAWDEMTRELYGRGLVEKSSAEANAPWMVADGRTLFELLEMMPFPTQDENAE
jgi:hypothetical protein